VNRRHWVELHELPSCPDFVRRLATDYLFTVSRVFGAHRPVVPRLARLLREADVHTIVDLCSGGGGPVVQAAEMLRAEGGLEDLELVLTDLYPNTAAFERIAGSEHVRAEPAPVDARSIPRHLSGVRTLFDSFHHFRPEDARAILADARKSHAGILVVEGTERSVKGVVGLVIAAPLLVLLLTPLVRPFTWWRLLFTYVVPLAPLLAVFDGVVSCLRTYTPEELRALTRGLEDEDYAWDVGVDRVAGQPLTWLTGTPLRRWPPTR
jgi:hypothetical protein